MSLLTTLRVKSDRPALLLGRTSNGLFPVDSYQWKNSDVWDSTWDVHFFSVCWLRVAFSLHPHSLSTGHLQKCPRSGWNPSSASDAMSHLCQSSLLTTTGKCFPLLRAHRDQPREFPSHQTHVTYTCKGLSLVRTNLVLCLPDRVVGRSMNWRE